MWTPCNLISPAFLFNEAIFCLRITTLFLGAMESFYCLSENLFCNKCIIQNNYMILDSKLEHALLAFQPIHLEIRRQNLNCLSWRHQKSRLKRHAPPGVSHVEVSRSTLLHPWVIRQKDSGRSLSCVPRGGMLTHLCFETISHVHLFSQKEKNDSSSRML